MPIQGTEMPALPTSIALRTAFAACAALAGLLGNARAGQTALVEPGAGAHSAGHVALNVAAGVGNVQLNQAALAPTGTAGATLEQAASGGAAGASLRSIVGAGAFAGSSGLLAVNEASGAANLQSNIALFGAHTHVGIASDGQLATALPRPAPGAGPAPSTVSRIVSIDPGAFHGATGLVQVNQTAGSGNSTGNAFMLQLPGSSLSNFRSIP